MDLQSLAQLCLCPAPLGDEYRAIELIREKIPEGFSVKLDPVGSLIVQKEGKKPGFLIFASLSQPTLLVEGKCSDGSWKLRAVGTQKAPETLADLEVGDGKEASAQVRFENGTLQLKEEKNIETGIKLTQRPSWSQDEGNIYCGALSDRVGAWLLMELLQNMPSVEREVTFVFLAQEGHNPKVAELMANETDCTLAVRVGSAPVNKQEVTGVAVQRENGPAIKLRERYASTDARLLDIIRKICRSGNIPYQYELEELTVTGLSHAQYGHCGVVIGGIDVPEEQGRISKTDLTYARQLLHTMMQDVDSIMETMEGLPAVYHSSGFST